MLFLSDTSLPIWHWLPLDHRSESPFSALSCSVCVARERLAVKVIGSKFIDLQVPLYKI
jgi:hypothetical protein